MRRPAPVPRIFDGTEPFPNLERWTADGALFATQALRARLTGSDEHLVDELVGLPEREWLRTALSPEIFAFLANEPRVWSTAELAEALRDSRGRRPCGRTTVYSEPGPLFEQLLRRLGKGSRRDDCSEASFLAVDDERFLDATGKLSEATELVAETLPGFAADMDAAVHGVALVDDLASFRGSSGVIHRGLVFLSPTPDWTVATFAEELVHETMHNLIDLLGLRDPLLSGDDVYEERHAAPFRPDKRHVFGNFHAVLVVARLLLLFERFDELGVAGDDWRARSLDYASRSKEPLDVVVAYPGLNALARLLVEEFARPVIDGVLQDA